MPCWNQLVDCHFESIDGFLYEGIGVMKKLNSVETF